MKGLYIGAAVAAALLTGGTAFAMNRKRSPQDKVKPLAELPPVVPSMKAVGTPAAAGLPGLTKVGGAAGIVGAGLVFNELQGRVVDGVVGTNAGNFTRLFGQATLPVLVGKGAGELTKALGGSAGLQQTANQLAGVGAAAAAVFGAPALVGVASAKAVGEGASALIGLIGGKQAERDVRNAVSQLDPFKTGSLAQQAVAPVGNAIRDVGNFFGGLFGGGRK